MPLGTNKLTQTGQFRKDVKRQAKRAKDLAKLKAVVGLLQSGSELPERLRDHSLSGNWSGWRDCHIDPDWLLIYKLLPDELILGRTGSHSDLF
ncbi:type II toxin-antitoxin system YafQ family toxin [Luteolibacter sp. Populi]|uniref:type II toxin-antitoxin system YafQ family toxin n=1 Tax=Luteolibacter sp. Populi TaxID=3230487 RepID=UPI003465E87C